MLCFVYANFLSTCVFCWWESAHNSINWVSQWDWDLFFINFWIHLHFFPSRETIQLETFLVCFRSKTFLGCREIYDSLYVWLQMYSEKLLAAICSLLDGSRPIHAVFLCFPSFPHLLESLSLFTDCSNHRTSI